MKSQTPAVSSKNPVKELAIMLGAESFFFPAGETGCLLIHGFNGSPDGVRQMGERLAAAEITALGVRLHGHGTDIAEMDH
jgi:carboxylesterase